MQRRNCSSKEFGGPIVASLIVMLIFVFVLSNARAQVADNVDPNVEQFAVARGIGDASYNGAVDVSIPLMTIPGINGLDYDISLKYVNGNGVPISKAATWVGLGWNLQNYEITCDPTFDDIGFESGQYYYYLRPGYRPVPDFYHLSYPGGMTGFWMDGSDCGTPVNWSAIKIKGIRDGSTLEYKSFVIYGIDGTKYVFGDRLKKQAGDKLINHDLLYSATKGYYYVFKLTAILPADYIDGGGDPVVPGDGGSDKGGWIKLIYTSPVGFVNSDSWLYQEIDYLSSVITPTHTASFNCGDGAYVFIVNNRPNSGLIQALDNITLRRNSQETPIRMVKFYQSGGFDWLYFDVNSNINIYHWDSQTWPLTGIRARARLDSLKISAGDGAISEPSYRFDYFYDPSIDFTSSQPLYQIDNWGYLDTIADVFTTHPTKYFTYGMLKKIIYPTGGIAEFEYESNYFTPEPGSERAYYSTDPVMAGGLRLLRQTITDPQTNQSMMYQYRYGEAHPSMGGMQYSGSGFISSDPGVNVNRLETIYRLASDVRFDVHYPIVTTIHPDNSMTRRYFTSACTEFTSFSWMFCDEQVEPVINYSNSSTWPSLTSYQQVSLIPYYHHEQQGYKSYQGNDFANLNYPIAFGTYHIDDVYDFMTPSVLNGLASCEAAEFDDCNVNLRVSYYVPPPYYPRHIAGYIKTVGIDNSWKRGYLLKEEKYSSSSNTDPIWSKRYYYDMVLRNAQDYSIVLDGDGPGVFSFTECSGQVKLTKTVEKTY